MLFNSFTYIFFFIAVAFLYYAAPHKFRHIILLIASCIFYMCWQVEFILLIFFAAFVNFILSKWIYEEKYKPKKLFILSLVINFGMLFFFKYLVFANDSLIALLARLGLKSPVSHFDIILPMGISFYTFQAASYTIDVYQKKYKPVQAYHKLLLYIVFFPQLVAGPIERADRLYPQLFTKKKFKLENLIIGVKFTLLGFFRKIVIADRVSVLVNTVYDSPAYFDGLSLIIATVLFTFQIYCDFCGYSEIALGSAKILGIDLMENFKSPYFAASTKEFWQRWHISLSTWFKDYIYIPLGGNRVTKPKHYMNLFITFTVSGVWHGANWTYIVWGMLHGLYQIIGNITYKWRNGVIQALHMDKLFYLPKCFFTFLLVCFAFLFFRANSIADAFYIASHLFTGLTNITQPQYIYDTLNGLSLTVFEISISFACIVLMTVLDFFGRKENIHRYLDGKPFLIRYAVYTLLAVILLALAVQNSGNEFIYFQF